MPYINKDTLALSNTGYAESKEPIVHHGAIYILNQSGSLWVEKQILFPSRKGSGWRFGHKIDIDDDTLVAAAPKEPLAGTSSGMAGAAYIYRRSGKLWKQEARIVPNDLKNDDFFAWDLALEGNTAVFGAWGQDAMGSRSGAVYVFNRTGSNWIQGQKVQPSDLKKDSFLGHGLAIDGDIMAVGARGDGDNGAYAGAVYIFQWDGFTWKQKHKVYSPNLNRVASFGRDVSMDYPLVATSAVDGTAEAVYVIELNVLVSHDGGPPGSQGDAGMDHDHLLPDRSGNPMGDGQTGTDPGCSCRGAPSGQAGDFYSVLLITLCLVFGLRRRKPPPW